MNKDRYAQLKQVTQKALKFRSSKLLSPELKIIHSKHMEALDKAILNPEKATQAEYEKLLIAYFELLTGMSDQPDVKNAISASGVTGACPIHEKPF